MLYSQFLICTIITCSKCDFNASELKTWGAWYYKAGELKVPVRRTLAICYTCNTITSMEVLPDSSTVEQLQKKLIDDPKDPVILFLLTDEKQRLDLFKERKAPPKCLHCLGSDVEAIPNVEPDWNEGRMNPKWQVGLKHRDCGGDLCGNNGPNFNFGSSLKEYTFDVAEVLKV